jgi:uncharacterized peroxidase-related enzyme
MPELDWRPWLESPSEEQVASEGFPGLVDPDLVKAPTYRLWSLDPEILVARTLTYRDIFWNMSGGMPREERELVGVVVSLAHGCEYAAFAHARIAEPFPRGRDVERVRVEGTTADLGDRWNVIVFAADALARPNAFDSTHFRRLSEAGLGILEILDLVHAASFFSWGNRLVLALGEPYEVER